MHGSAAGAPVHGDGWDEGGGRCHSQPSQHERISQNQSGMQERILKVRSMSSLESLSFPIFSA